MTAHADAHHAGADPTDAGLSGGNVQSLACSVLPLPWESWVRAFGRIALVEPSPYSGEGTSITPFLGRYCLVPAILGPAEDLADNDGMADALGVAQEREQTGRRDGGGYLGATVVSSGAGGAAASPGFFANWLTSWLNTCFRR